MDAEEFADTIEQLRKEINLVSSCHTVYVASGPTADQTKTLDRYVGFFWPVREALRQTILMTIARIVDVDHRTASIPNLIKAVRKNPEYVPHAAEDDIKRLEQANFDVARIVEKLIIVRHKRLAHWDRGDVTLPTIEKRDLDSLIEHAKTLFNEFSGGIDSSETIWRVLDQDAALHTKRLFEEAELGALARHLEIEEQMQKGIEELNRKLESTHQ